MSRGFVAISFRVIVCLMAFADVTEIVTVSDFTYAGALLHFLCTVLAVIAIILFCGFAALHAAQRVASPQERAEWLVIIIALTIIGSAFYLLTKYQHFRKSGRGGLLRVRKQTGWKDFLSLSKEERIA